MTDMELQAPETHFVTVGEILDDYKGSLAAYLADVKAVSYTHLTLPTT